MKRGERKPSYSNEKSICHNTIHPSPGGVRIYAATREQVSESPLSAWRRAQWACRSRARPRPRGHP